MMCMGSKSVILRIPRHLIKVETDDYVLVEFGDAELFLKAVLSSLAVSDQGKAVVMKVDE